MSGTLRILFLEDSLYDVELEIATLETAGYTCQWQRVESRADFLACLDDSAQDYDIVLADYNLPAFDGLTALKLFLERNLNIPFIIVSGALGEEIAIESLKTGATDYVLKNRLSRLPPVVERALREKEVQRQRRQAEAKIRRQNRELTLLNRVITTAVADLPLEELLKITCTELGQVFKADRITAALLDEGKHKLIVVAEYRNDEDFPSILNQTLLVADVPVYPPLLAKKKPLVIDANFSGARLKVISSWLKNRHILSLLLLPLLAENDLIGALCLASSKTRRFLDQDVELAWRVSNQISASLTRARLEEGRRRLNTAIEQTTDSVVITDTEGTILYVNAAFEKITGYSRAEAIGQNPRILKSGEHNLAYYQTMWNTISAGQVWQGQLVNKKKDGSRYTENVVIAPVYNKRGQIINYIANKRDITHELQLEEKYRQAQKMEAIGLLAGGIAHDFNNILTVILGYSGVLLANFAPEDPRYQDLEQIRLSAERASVLTRQLLAFSRKQVLRPQILNLNSVISNLKKMLQRIIGEDITLITNLSPELGPIKADPGHLEQVLMNLAVNARDAMPSGGQLILNTRNQPVDSVYTARYPNPPPGNYVVLSVTDTGQGIDKAIQPRIFEPFFTTKKTSQGTGLGLSTVYGIVQQNKGYIDVDSVPEQGTTFYIYFPRFNAASETISSPEPASKTTKGNETILLVEDEDGVRLITAKMLQNLGYTVLTAHSAAKALELSRQNEQIDLIITDVIMPDMSGPELINKLKEFRPQLKTLFASGYIGEMLDKYDIDSSSVSFLKKPFTAETLGAKVREALKS